MNTVFTLIFIVGCIGTWYFIKKKQNKKNRNISIGLIVLSILLMSIFPSSDSKESAKSSDKDTKSSTKISSKNEALALTVPKEVLSNDDGHISIKGNTSPHAEVTIGMGVVGDKTTANKSGDFELSYDMDFQDETTLTINSRLDGNSKSSKVKVKMNETALAKLEQKEAETSKIEESKAAEKKRIKESKEAQNNTMSSSSENNEDSDITKLADGATSGQADILNELALQQFDKSYPYKGSKLHIVLGRIQDWTQKDGKWFAKFDATIVNAFDAERKTNVEVTIEPATASSGYVSFLDY
ncbi:hypothetical protein ABE945_15555 [Enterococcus gilvus]|uniref:hypothetical protein n=1 Tax=Enterococcus gilvus TaxID=160453 RepID=UPI003D6BB8BB